ncbi:MAG: hypothetical protein NW241_01660 [Bacteroidia bacterium]|nr:hypothetical protein [Bacteroidia bacterium]
MSLFLLLLWMHTTPGLAAPAAGPGMEPHVAASLPPRLYLMGSARKGEFVEVQYEITNPGFVELHLFDAEGKKLWIRGKVTDRAGQDYIQIPTKPLETGKRYSFILKYKGQEYSGSFYA